MVARSLTSSQSSRSCASTDKSELLGEIGLVKPVAGSYYQFFLAKDNLETVWKHNAVLKPRELTTWKHLDVFCAWDKGEEHLDAKELSNNTRHTRLTFSHTLFKALPDNSRLQATWEAFLNTLQVDIDELAVWVRSLLPASIHDFKPLIVLLQAVVEALVKKELKFYSGTVSDLQRRMREALELIEAQAAEIEELRRLLESTEEESASRRRDTVILKTAGHLRSSMLSSRNQSLKELKGELERQDAKSEDAASMRLKELQELNERLAAKDSEIADLKKELAEARTRIDVLEEDVGQKSVKLSKHTVTLTQKEKRIIDLSSTVAERDLTLLQERQNANVGYMSWVSNNPFVASMWATTLTLGLHTLTLAPESEIQLSQKNMLHGHFVDVPGRTRMLLPEMPVEPAGKRWQAKIEKPANFFEVTLPSNSMIEFPSNSGQEMPEDDVIFYGGTVVTLPDEGPDELCLYNIPPGTRIVVPKDAAADASSTAMNTEDETDAVTVPPGPHCRVKLVRGSSIRLPTGLRTKLRVPSGITVTFLLGQQHTVSLPAGTTIVMPAGNDCSALLPASTVLRLPVQDVSNISYTRGEHITVDRSFHVMLSSGATVLLPSAEQPFTTTLPAGTNIEAPAGAQGSSDIAAGETITISNGIPRTLACPAGSTITLPAGHSADAAKIAKLMMLYGPDCTSLAIGGMDPVLVVAAFARLSSGFSEKTPMIAETLKLARYDVAFQILRRMTVAMFGNMIHRVSPSVAGSWMSQYSAKERPQLLLENNWIERSHALAIVDSAHRFCACKKALAARKQGQSITQPIETLMGFDVTVGVGLIATSTSCATATVINAMAYVNHDQAYRRVEGLVKLAQKTNTYGMKFKGDDIVMAKLLQALELADTDTEVREEVSKLMLHFEKCYKFCCTLSRLDVAELRREDEAPQAAQPIKATPEEDDDFDEEAEDNSEFAQEQAAQDKLDIIYSTEDIKWGATASNKKSTGSSVLGVSTQMNAQRLFKFQEEAVRHKQLLIKDAMMVMPVYLDDGTPVACISHLNVEEASGYLLGGFLLRWLAVCGDAAATNHWAAPARGLHQSPGSSCARPPPITGQLLHTASANHWAAPARGLYQSLGSSWRDSQASLWHLS
ncbi:hypothetical protein CYMTET_32245 [Cymbomonas tetramitiformis]|uniref:Uncharacterized protein n=1 Tax=Cymbomonas tetramitiformis TaxID=36881 RepID=A0AAE0FG18_9CHLO|nr:hypothetical protein CYMTET_32245 [Cymbomonas tetramitiformis]